MANTIELGLFGCYIRVIYKISTWIAVHILNKNLSGYKNTLEQSINDMLQQLMKPLPQK